jgi:hypothetical protein
VGALCQEVDHPHGCGNAECGCPLVDIRCQNLRILGSWRNLSDLFCCDMNLFRFDLHISEIFSANIYIYNKEKKDKESHKIPFDK